MDDPLKIGLIGDYDDTITAHRAIPTALALAGEAARLAIEPIWFSTETLERGANTRLAACHGLWCVPGSPYRSMPGAIEAIRYAREQGRPFLGTCGGFQHALLEFARHQLGLPDADHEESNPGASTPVIARLACSLAETQEIVVLKSLSRVRGIYGAPEVLEQFNCNFGFNRRYQSIFAGSALAATGVDRNGEMRIVELGEHAFFIATLFQPERSALGGIAHPLINAFVEAAARSRV